MTSNKRSKPSITPHSFILWLLLPFTELEQSCLCGVWSQEAGTSHLG